MSSIYQLSSESQLEINTDFSLGEGNFGVVYRGIMTRSNGEWDLVRNQISHSVMFPDILAEEIRCVHKEMKM